MNDIIISRVTQLSKNAGKKPTVCMVESGVGRNFFVHLRNNQKPSVEKIVRLADYFGVTTDYIIGRSDIMKEVSIVEGQYQNTAIVDLINYAHMLSEGELADVLKYIEFIRSKRSDEEIETVSGIDYFKPAKASSPKKI